MDSSELLDMVKAHGSERYIADRVSDLRRQRGWSQDELVKQMRSRGCVMPQSAISKLEKPPSGGRRAVTVDEALAFAKVFGMSIEELVLPPDLLTRKHLHEGLLMGAHLRHRYMVARIDYDTLIATQLEAMAADSEWKSHVYAVLAESRANQPSQDKERNGARLEQLDFLEDLVTRFESAS